MPHRFRYRLPILVALIGLAFVLRLYRLDDVPLRGDEAFAVRYWADSPGHVIHDLAETEPHPFGTFFGFWAWKQTAGDSAFAMRYLPLLGNLIGAAAAAALARRLFRHDGPAILAAGLWAVHPFLIWHAQDVRNYAIWAGISPLAMLLFLRAIQSNRSKSWALYVLVETAALYVFFLEAFLIPVQAALLILQGSPRPVLRRVIFAWIIIGLLLIPWFAHLWVVGHSGYEGTTQESSPAKLITWFLPTLAAGRDFDSPWDMALPLAWIVVVIGLITALPPARKIGLWVAAWGLIPAILLLIAATQMSIFHPRYLIAITPALILLMARALWPDDLKQKPSVSASATIARIALLALVGSGVWTLVDYYRGENAKSPDWPALAAYLEARVQPDDVIVQTQADPAFRYYYREPVEEFSLEPGKDITEQFAPALETHTTFWLIGRLPEAETYLQDHLQMISFHTLSNFSIMQFRQWIPESEEIQTPVGVTFGEIARLKGYTILGPDDGLRAITVLLYWEPLAQSQIDYHVFVHLVGSPRVDGNPLWDQEDHVPLYGVASTLTWDISSLYRDPYHLLERPETQLAPGVYSIQAGMYDPATNDRLPVFDQDGTALGDSYTIGTLAQD
ncbi:MAG: glycosyltransferase family 39 protein [Chloroflexi bacterium]|nr:glycosyltransferase family 39 protein [Chloroflexota bacterium]